MIPEINVFRRTNDVVKETSRLDVLYLQSDVRGLAAESIDLNDMGYAFDARLYLKRGCLPRIRGPLLHEICDILDDPNEGAPQVCFLTGVTGSGKSAVAYSIA